MPQGRATWVGWITSWHGFSGCHFDRGLSKEHKDLEPLHELKGPMTRSRAKLLQEEMAKRNQGWTTHQRKGMNKSQGAELEHVEDC